MTRVKVYRWLAQQPQPVRLREIAAAMDITDGAASQIMLALQRIGAAKRTGRTHGARWVAWPSEGVAHHRGDHPNSLKNLRHRWERPARKTRKGRAFKLPSTAALLMAAA